MPAGNIPSSCVITRTRWTWQITIKVSARGTRYRSWKMKTKTYSCSHFPRNWAATTKAGAAIDRHCLISFGCLSQASAFLFFFPTLPPSETYLRILVTLYWVTWKIWCFEKTCRCWNRWRSKTIRWRECISHRSLLPLVPNDRVKQASRCTPRPVDFSSYLCPFNEG